MLFHQGAELFVAFFGKSSLPAPAVRLRRNITGLLDVVFEANDSGPSDAEAYSKRASAAFPLF